MSDRSDQSGYSSNDDRYDDDRLDYEGSSSDNDSQDDDGVTDEEDPPTSSKDADALDLTNLKLCSTHKAGDMVRSCTMCAAALALIGDKSKIKLLTKESEKDSYLSKFRGRCDDIVPTMDLNESTIEVATEVFSKGQFRDKRIWGDIVKNYLTLPQDVHQSLSIDFKLEDYFERLKREKRFQHVFKSCQVVSRICVFPRGLCSVLLNSSTEIFPVSGVLVSPVVSSTLVQLQCALVAMCHVTHVSFVTSCSSHLMNTCS